MKTVKPTEILQQAAAELSSPCYFLIQGYPYTGFGSITKAGSLEWPVPQEGDLDWNLYWDLRAFGKLPPQSGGQAEGWAEWHLFRGNDGQWDCRVVRSTCSKCNEKWARSIGRSYILVGRTQKKASEDWVMCFNASGAKIWLPKEFAGENEVRLKMALRWEVDPTSGLTGFVDSRIAGFERVLSAQTATSIIDNREEE